MELYRFKLTPADRKSEINFTSIENQYQLFTTAASNCSQGVSFKRDGKRITIDEIEQQQITITLYSSSPLTSPTRTLSAFSRELLRLDKEYNVLSESVYNHTLFSTEQIKVAIESHNSINDISDSVYLKSFIDLIYSNDYEEELNQIKSILLKCINSGLI